MIQFYINSRPVPRAVARSHLAKGAPHWTVNRINQYLNEAKTDTTLARLIAEYGVSVSII